MKGTLEEVLKKAEEEGACDFVSVTLTDEEELYRPGERLQKAYEYLLEYRIENRRTRNFMEGDGERPESGGSAVGISDLL